MGSIGVGFGFEVGAGPSTGVGFGKPFREELAGEGVVCAFTKASSRLFLNSSAAFFSCCFCKKNTPPRPRKITTKMVFLITENRGTMSYTLRAFNSVFQHRTDNFSVESLRGLGLSFTSHLHLQMAGTIYQRILPLIRIFLCNFARRRCRRNASSVYITTSCLDRTCPTPGGWMLVTLHLPGSVILLAK